MVKNPKNWQPEFLYEYLSCNSSLGNKGINMIFFCLKGLNLKIKMVYNFFLFLLFHCNIENYFYSVKIGPIAASQISESKKSENFFFRFFNRNGIL